MKLFGARVPNWRHIDIRAVVEIGALVFLAVIGFNVQKNQHDSCRRGIASNVTSVRELSSKIVHTQAVVDDPSQPKPTKEARQQEVHEAVGFRLRRYNHVDPAHGGPIRCPSPPIIEKLIP